MLSFGGGYVVLWCLCCVLRPECGGMCKLGGWALLWRSELLLGSILRFEFLDSAQVERFCGLSHFGCKAYAEI